jgi:RsiW-degrading membrane proteinase PrsW (M82 family)
LNLYLLASAPVIIILIYVYVRDKYEKEPLGLLLKALLAGALTTIPVGLADELLAVYSVNFTGLTGVGFVAFIMAGLNEELFKFLALILVIWNNRNFNEKFDGIVYGVYVSLGFALVENLMYVFRYGHETGIVRALTAIPAHAIFGVTMGYFLAFAKLGSRRRSLNFAKALIIPVLLHGIYDFILMSQHPMYLVIFLPFLYYLWSAGFKKMNQLSDISKFKP